MTQDFDTNTLSYKPPDPRPLDHSDVAMLAAMIRTQLQPMIGQPANTQQLLDAAQRTCVMWILKRNRTGG